MGDIRLYSGARDGGKTWTLEEIQAKCDAINSSTRAAIEKALFFISNVTPTTITVTSTRVVDTEKEQLLKQLQSQWNRAKVQKNKNLMRDIEARIKSVRGY